MMALLWLLVGVVVGIVGYRLYFTRMPGQPIGMYEQAVVREGATMHNVDGPYWLSMAQTFRLHGVYDVTDKTLKVHVEPAYAPLANDPASAQRLFADMVVIYRPTSMKDLLRLEQSPNEWITSMVTTVVKAHARLITWNPITNPQQLTDAVRAKLELELPSRGLEIVDLYCEGVGTVPTNVLESRAAGLIAQNMGRAGIVREYLTALTAAGGESNTMVSVNVAMGELNP